MNYGIWWSQQMGDGDSAMMPIGIPFPWFPHMRPMPANCMECNGQNVPDITSPLYGQQLPNMNAGRVLVGSIGEACVEVGGPGQVTLAKAHLPGDDISVTTSQASAGTPAGTVSVASGSAGTPAGTVSVVAGGAHTHTIDNAAAQTITSSNDGAHTHNYDRASTSKVNASILALGTPVVENVTPTATASTSAGAHTHTTTVPAHGHTMQGAPDHSHTATFSGQALASHGHTATFSGQALANHGHTATLKLNDGVQQAIDLTPKGITCRWIIRIK